MRENLYLLAGRPASPFFLRRFYIKTSNTIQEVSRIKEIE
jgi:hypothetical protein